MITCNYKMIKLQILSIPSCYTLNPATNDYNGIDTKSYKKVFFKKLYDIYLTKKWRKI